MHNITYPSRVWFLSPRKILIIIQPVLYQSETSTKKNLILNIMVTLGHLHMIKLSTQNVGKILDLVSFFPKNCFPPAWTYYIKNVR